MCVCPPQSALVQINFISLWGCFVAALTHSLAGELSIMLTLAIGGDTRPRIVLWKRIIAIFIGARGQARRNVDKRKEWKALYYRIVWHTAYI